MSGDLSDLNNPPTFSLFLCFFYSASLPQNKTKCRPNSKISNVKIQRLFEITLEKQQASEPEKWSLKGEWKEVDISYYKNAFITGKHILKVYNTNKQKKRKIQYQKVKLDKNYIIYFHP